MKTFLEIIFVATLVSLTIGQNYRYHGERYGHNDNDHDGYGGYGCKNYKYMKLIIMSPSVFLLLQILFVLLSMTLIMVMSS